MARRPRTLYTAGKQRVWLWWETRESERRVFMSRCWVMASCISTGRADKENEERDMAGDAVDGKGRRGILI